MAEGEFGENGLGMDCPKWKVNESQTRSNTRLSRNLPVRRVYIATIVHFSFSSALLTIYGWQLPAT
jgi:hypothetical protein